MKAAVVLAMALTATLLLGGGADGRLLAQRDLLEHITPGRGPTLTTAISLPDEGEAGCYIFSNETMYWKKPSSPVYGASGNSQPPMSDVQELITRMCQDPSQAGQEVLKMIQAGGQEAQTAVYAIHNEDCLDADAGMVAYGAAINIINDGNPASLPATTEFFTNLAAAANAVGIPLCLSLAVFHSDTFEVLQEETFHTGEA